MTYRIAGLEPGQFEPFFAADEAELPALLARRVIATSDSGFPCRVSLEDAKTGERLLLLHHVSNDVATPFRMAHAIYVREGAVPPAPLRDRVPAMLDARTIGLRAFDGGGMVVRAVLALPGEADAHIRALFSDPDIAYIHAHNAAYGCYLAAVERDDD